MEPNQLLEHVNQRDEKTWGPVDRRIEEYEHLVVRDWLREAFPSSSELRSNAAALETQRAVRLIAAISSARRADSWLDQLLTTSALPDFSKAVGAQGEALAASERADYVLALHESHVAQQLFIQMGDAAGLSRARFEEVFALHFSNNAPECATHAAPLVKEAIRDHFAGLLCRRRLKKASAETPRATMGMRTPFSLPP